MIIKRIEKDDLIKSIYESSTILASTYNKATNDLTIIFKGGGQYQYKGVKSTDYTRFETADSQGTILNSHIKAYPFAKLDKVDTAVILTEIKNVTDTAIKSMADLLVATMSNIVKSVEQGNPLNDGSLKNLRDVMNKYNTIRGIPNE